MAEYRKWLIIYVITVIVFVSITLVFSTMITTSSYSLFKFIENNYLALVLFGLASIISPFIGVAIGLLLGSFFLSLHNKLVGKKMAYYIQEKTKSRMFKFKFVMVFFPALLAINFGTSLTGSDFILQLILTEEAYIEAQLYTSMKFIPLSLFVALTLIFSLILFIPAYILEDSGIVYINKEKAINSNKTIEVRGVGNWYLSILKGYTGIGTLINIYFLAFDIFGSMEGDPALISMAFTTWFFQPFLLSLLLIPVMIILDKTFERNMKKIQKTQRKLGITSPISDIIPI